jgi:hypothetical protein
MQAESDRVERDLALAIAFTPVAYRHRVIRVIDPADRLASLGYAACELPAGHPALRPPSPGWVDSAL